MTKGYFDAPVFELEKCEIDVDISTTSFFFNDNGNPAYLKSPPQGVTPLVPAPTNPNVAIGREYVVLGVIGVKPTPPYGIKQSSDSSPIKSCTSPCGRPARWLRRLELRW